jgi:Flp pilus assembly protein TadG
MGHRCIRDRASPLRQVVAQQQGATLVYFALILPILMSMAGLAIDGSNLYAQAWRMQNAADAAVMSGVRAIALGQTTAQVSSIVNSLATANGATTVSWSYVENGKGIQVVARRTFPAYFAGILGYETFSVHATAGGDIFVPGSMGNLLPMTTMCDDMSNDADPGFTFGASYTFWNNDMTAPGNFGWLDWNGGSVGDSELADNIAHPSNSSVWKVGDWLNAGPGVKSSAAVKVALDKWIGKQVTIPLYDQVTGTGSGARYRVCSFAEFILQSYDFSSSNKWVRGSFVRLVQRGGSSGNPPDFGISNFRLIQ